MKEMTKRVTFHMVAGIVLVLVWSYFASEWWSPVIGYLAILFGIIPVVVGFFALIEPYRTETAKTIEDAAKLVGQGFEYVCTHNKTMIFKRPKYED
jgi:uncharacterized membrane protein